MEVVIAGIERLKDVAAVAPGDSGSYIIPIIVIGANCYIFNGRRVGSFGHTSGNGSCCQRQRRSKTNQQKQKTEAKGCSKNIFGGWHNTPKIFISLTP